MRRRVATALIGLALIGAATACPADTGSTSPPPVVVSANASPNPAVAGGPLTFEVHATHPFGIYEAHVLVIARDNGILPAQHQCAQAAALATPGADSTEGIATITCTLPANMPNDAWTAQLNVTSKSGTTTIVAVPFVVTGGTDDHSGPEISATAAFPTSTTAGSTFTVPLRLTDQNPPFAGVTAAYTTPAGTLVDSPITCTPGPITPVDATSADVTFTCTVLPVPVLGTYRIHIIAADDFALLGNLAFDVSVV